jgi:hypothetical protein
MCGKNRDCVPEPVLFNCLKHHAGYVAEFAASIDVATPEGKAALRANLNLIGSSQMDLYTGTLSACRIAGEITDSLKTLQMFDEPTYLSWLGPAKPAYRNIGISDGSVWVLLPGKTANRYIHIHPGRYSPFTLRIRSDTMKTAIAVLCHCHTLNKNSPDLGLVNEVRTSFLGLSAIKDLSPDRGLGKLIRTLYR